MKRRKFTGRQADLFLQALDMLTAIKQAARENIRTRVLTDSALLLDVAEDWAACMRVLDEDIDDLSAIRMAFCRSKYARVPLDSDR